MNVIQSTPLRAAQRMVFDVPVCEFGWADALDFVDKASLLPIGQTVISFLNANNANLSIADQAYQAVLKRHIVLPDGVGIDMASWLFYGAPFPANLNGTDFVPALMTYMKEPRRVAMIGASSEILAKAAMAFKAHAPWHEFIAIADGYFDESQSDAIMAKVKAANADILLVAMGSPKQEKWIDRHVGPGHARIVLGVGALFNFMAQDVARAPLLMRRMRLEWLHRLVVEPKRLWRRYVLGIPLFLFHAVWRKLANGDQGSKRGEKRLPANAATRYLGFETKPETAATPSRPSSDPDDRVFARKRS